MADEAVAKVELECWISEYWVISRVNFDYYDFIVNCDYLELGWYSDCLGAKCQIFLDDSKSQYSCNILRSEFINISPVNGWPEVGVIRSCGERYNCLSDCISRGALGLIAEKSLALDECYETYSQTYLEEQFEFHLVFFNKLCILDMNL